MPELPYGRMDGQTCRADAHHADLDGQTCKSYAIDASSDDRIFGPCVHSLSSDKQTRKSCAQPVSLDDQTYGSCAQPVSSDDQTCRSDAKSVNLDDRTCRSCAKPPSSDDQTCRSDAQSVSSDDRTHIMWVFNHPTNHEMTKKRHQSVALNAASPFASKPHPEPGRGRRDAGSPIPAHPPGRMPSLRAIRWLRPFLAPPPAPFPDASGVAKCRAGPEAGRGRWSVVVAGIRA